MNKYDVIIVGAGPAGLMLAHLLENSSLKVILVESRTKLEDIPNYRFGTFRETVDKFALSKCVIKSMRTFKMFGSDHEVASFTYEKEMFDVIDMKHFIKLNPLQCDLKLGYVVQNVTRSVDGIVINDVEGEVIKAKIIVDCSGNNKVISRILYPLGHRGTIDCLSTSWEMEGCAKLPEEDAMVFMLDLRYTNIGLWFYPYSATECQIGQFDIIGPHLPLIPGQEKSLSHFIEQNESWRTSLATAKLKESITKVGPTISLTPMVGDRFLACGDAAGAGTPVIGEGFRVAMEMAASAAETIKQANKKQDFEKKTLSLHSRNFRQQFGKYYRWSRLLRWLDLNCASNKELGTFVSNLNKLSLQEFIQFLRSEITFKMIIKLINPSIIYRCCINYIRHKLQPGKPLNKRL